MKEELDIIRKIWREYYTEKYNYPWAVVTKGKRRKCPSKRRILARFMIGKWVTDLEIERAGLNGRLAEIPRTLDIRRSMVRRTLT